MPRHRLSLVLLPLLLAGCAGDSGYMFGAGGATASLPEEPKARPECAALSSRIDTLRQDGVTDRAAQAASTGKTATVQVKRASLGQLAELDKANAEFQSKCSSLPPRTATATFAPAPTVAPKPATAAMPKGDVGHARTAKAVKTTTDAAATAHVKTE